jgi:two-component system, OmpR family, sensor histidine kinase CreC
VTARIQTRTHALAFQAATEDARLVGLIANRGLEQSGTTFRAAIRSLRASGALFRFGAGPGDTRVQFYDANGRCQFDSGVTEEDLDRRPRIADDRTAPDVADALRGSTRDEPFLLDAEHVAAAAPIRKDDRVVGVIRIIKPSLGMQVILEELAPEIMLLAACFVALVVAIALVLGRSLSRPVKRLTAATRKIAAGARSQSLPEPRGREVAELTEAFYEMRRELEDRRRIERLSQDLSHELKNPIAAIRSLSEALAAGALTDPEAGPRLLARIDEATGRLEAIVTDLLALARLEAKGIDRAGRVELARLVAEARAEALAGHPEAPVVEVDVNVPQAVPGDAVWLKRALVNLLTNAIEASGRAKLRALIDGDKVRVTVSNPGEVPLSVREHLFERFVTRRPQGTGLGLAIVASVADAHGGMAYLAEPGPPEVVIGLSWPAT